MDPFNKVRLVPEPAFMVPKDKLSLMIIESSLKNQGRASSADLVQTTGLDLLSLSNRLKKLEMNQVLVYDKSSDEYILKAVSN